MEWKSGLDADLIGADCDAVLERAGLAAMLGELGEGLAYCVACSAGLAIIRLTGSGLAHCVAIAPAGALPEGPIAESELFARPWPDGWRTKRGAGLNGAPKDARGYELGGFACGLMEGRAVILARVVRLDELGGLAGLQTLPDGPEIAPQDHKARRFWPFHRWQEGARKLWARQGGRIIHNYQLACIQAANLEKGRKGQNGKKSKKSEKGP